MGYGVILCNSKGSPTRIYAGHCGCTTNNVAKLTTLDNGLSLDGKHECLRIHIVGDSKLIIQMTRNIIDGSPISKMLGSSDSRPN